MSKLKLGELKKISDPKDNYHYEATISLAGDNFSPGVIQGSLAASDGDDTVGGGIPYEITRDARDPSSGVIKIQKDPNEDARKFVFDIPSSAFESGEKPDYNAIDSFAPIKGKVYAPIPAPAPVAKEESKPASAPIDPYSTAVPNPSTPTGWAEYPSTLNGAAVSTPTAASTLMTTSTNGVVSSVGAGANPPPAPGLPGSSLLNSAGGYNSDTVTGGVNLKPTDVVIGDDLQKKIKDGVVTGIVVDPETGEEKYGGQKVDYETLTDKDLLNGSIGSFDDISAPTIDAAGTTASEVVDIKPGGSLSKVTAAPIAKTWEPGKTIETAATIGELPTFGTGETQNIATGIDKTDYTDANIFTPDFGSRKSTVVGDLNKKYGADTISATADGIESDGDAFVKKYGDVYKAVDPSAQGLLTSAAIKNDQADYSASKVNTLDPYAQSYGAVKNIVDSTTAPTMNVPLTAKTQSAISGMLAGYDPTVVDVSTDSLSSGAVKVAQSDFNTKDFDTSKSDYYGSTAVKNIVDGTAAPTMTYTDAMKTSEATKTAMAGYNPTKVNLGSDVYATGKVTAVADALKPASIENLDTYQGLTGVKKLVKDAKDNQPTMDVSDYMTTASDIQYLADQYAPNTANRTVTQDALKEDVANAVSQAKAGVSVIDKSSDFNVSKKTDAALKSLKATNENKDDARLYVDQATKDGVNALTANTVADNVDAKSASKVAAIVDGTAADQMDTSDKRAYSYDDILAMLSGDKSSQVNVDDARAYVGAKGDAITKEMNASTINTADQGAKSASKVADLVNGAKSKDINVDSRMLSSDKISELVDKTKAFEVNVSPDSLVSHRLQGLLSINNPYIQDARNQATVQASRRGLLNSGAAAGYAQDAAIRAGYQIAKDDAATYAEAERANALAKNQHQDAGLGYKVGGIQSDAKTYSDAETNSKTFANQLLDTGLKLNSQSVVGDASTYANQLAINAQELNKVMAEKAQLKADFTKYDSTTYAKLLSDNADREQKLLETQEQIKAQSKMADAGAFVDQSKANLATKSQHTVAGMQAKVNSTVSDAESTEKRLEFNAAQQNETALAKQNYLVNISQFNATQRSAIETAIANRETQLTSEKAKIEADAIATTATLEFNRQKANADADNDINKQGMLASTNAITSGAEIASNYDMKDADIAAKAASDKFTTNAAAITHDADTEFNAAKTNIDNAASLQRQGLLASTTQAGKDVDNKIQMTEFNKEEQNKMATEGARMKTTAITADAGVNATRDMTDATNAQKMTSDKMAGDLNAISHDADTAFNVGKTDTDNKARLVEQGMLAQTNQAGKDADARLDADKFVATEENKLTADKMKGMTDAAMQEANVYANKDITDAQNAQKMTSDKMAIDADSVTHDADVDFNAAKVDTDNAARLNEQGMLAKTQSAQTDASNVARGNETDATNETSMARDKMAESGRAIVADVDRYSDNLNKEADRSNDFTVEQMKTSQIMQDAESLRKLKRLELNQDAKNNRNDKEYAESIKASEADIDRKNDIADAKAVAQTKGAAQYEADYLSQLNKDADANRSVDAEVYRKETDKVMKQSEYQQMVNDHNAGWSFEGGQNKAEREKEKAIADASNKTTASAETAGNYVSLSLGRAEIIAKKQISNAGNATSIAIASAENELDTDKFNALGQQDNEKADAVWSQNWSIANNKIGNSEIEKNVDTFNKAYEAGTLAQNVAWQNLSQSMLNAVVTNAGASNALNNLFASKNLDLGFLAASQIYDTLNAATAQGYKELNDATMQDYARENAATAHGYDLEMQSIVDTAAKQRIQLTGSMDFNKAVVLAKIQALSNADSNHLTFASNVFSQYQNALAMVATSDSMDEEAKAKAGNLFGDILESSLSYSEKERAIVQKTAVIANTLSDMDILGDLITPESTEESTSTAATSSTKPSSNTTTSLAT